MSLNRALGELFKAVREEAAANPDFAAKLEAALAHYKPTRRKAKPAIKPPASLEAPPPPLGEAEAPPASAQPELNPIAFYSRSGEEVLRQTLAGEEFSPELLLDLVREHNLDPAETLGEADKPRIVEQIVAQARKRVERDRRLFDY